MFPATEKWNADRTRNTSGGSKANGSQAWLLTLFLKVRQWIAELGFEAGHLTHQILALHYPTVKTETTLNSALTENTPEEFTERTYSTFKE